MGNLAKIIAIKAPIIEVFGVTPNVEISCIPIIAPRILVNKIKINVAGSKALG